MASVTGRSVFNPNNSDSIDASHSVGSYNRAGNTGALISSHYYTESVSGSFDFADGDVDTGSDLVLELNHGFENGELVQLTSSGTLPAGLALATDYYIIRNSANHVKFAASALDAENGVAVDITAAAGGGTHTVTKQDRPTSALDVYMVNPIAVELTQADEITVYQGTDPWTVDGTVAVTQSTDPWVIGDGGNSITVDAVDLDIRDLDASTDNVAAWMADGAGTALTSTLVGSDQALDVNVVSSIDVDVDDDLADTDMSVTKKAVTDSSTALLASQLTNRKHLAFANVGQHASYLDKTTATTDSWPIFPGEKEFWRAGPSIDFIACITSNAAGTDVRVLELS